VTWEKGSGRVFGETLPDPFFSGYEHLNGVLPIVRDGGHDDLPVRVIIVPRSVQARSLQTLAVCDEEA
jgi:hypothetical protein